MTSNEGTGDREEGKNRRNGQKASRGEETRGRREEEERRTRTRTARWRDTETGKARTRSRNPHNATVMAGGVQGETEDKEMN